ncbi:unnamed protein product [Camellia sinensis]
MSLLISTPQFFSKHKNKSKNKKKSVAFMARQANHLVFLLVLSLCLTMLFTSIEASPINDPIHFHHHHHDKMKSRTPRRVGNGHRYDQVLALRGIKSGPSPGDGNSVVTGVHN